MHRVLAVTFLETGVNQNYTLCAPFAQTASSHGLESLNFTVLFLGLPNFSFDQLLSGTLAKPELKNGVVDYQLSKMQVGEERI